MHIENNCQSPEGGGEDGREKESEYYASKGGGGHYEEDEGGHARRRLEEMISQRFPAEADPGEEESEGSEVRKSPASPKDSIPGDKDKDEGVPGGK